MIYQIHRGWPVGQYFLEPGTRVDLSDPQWSWLEGQTPPPTCQVLDQEAYDALAAVYPYWVILSGEGVVRTKDPLG
jgi:hypothetical protein